MSTFNLMGVVITNRNENATKVQEVLTKHGCLIKTRLGLHETGDFCSNEGFLILQLTGEKNEIENFRNDLVNISGVSAENVSIQPK